MAKLEEQRDEQTKRNITLFQASCRGYLSRQAFKKRKVNTAVGAQQHTRTCSDFIHKSESTLKPYKELEPGELINADEFSILIGPLIHISRALSALRSET